MQLNLQYSKSIEQKTKSVTIMSIVYVNLIMGFPHKSLSNSTTNKPTLLF